MSPDPDTDPDTGPVSQRLDQWLWSARFLKSRTLAARLATSGKMRINGVHVSKAGYRVRAGDVLTFPLGSLVRVIRVRITGKRRGPFQEARRLYEDLAPPDPATYEPGTRPPETARPSKRQRRQIRAWKTQALKQGLPETDTDNGY